MLEDEESEIALAICYAARHLGTGNAATDMGAIEALGASVEKSVGKLADYTGEGLGSVSGDIRDGLMAVSFSLDGIADALNRIAAAMEGKNDGK